MKPPSSRLWALACAGLIAPALAGAVRAAPLFSEDFESGKLDPTVWSVETTGGNVAVVQADRAAHGRFALQVSCPKPSFKTWSFIRAKHLPAALRQHQFGRVNMYVTPKPPARHTILIMSGTDGFPNNKFQEVATTRGGWQLTYVDLRPNGDKEDYHVSTVPVPPGRWFCLEWEFNDLPNRSTIWVDGKQVYQASFASKRTGETSGLIGGFGEIAFGFRLWGSAPEAFDVYYDDIAIDTQRIGGGSESPVPPK
jgi:hypothetical protein